MDMVPLGADTYRVEGQSGAWSSAAARPTEVPALPGQHHRDDVHRPGREDPRPYRLACRPSIPIGWRAVRVGVDLPEAPIRVVNRDPASGVGRGRSGGERPSRKRPPVASAANPYYPGAFHAGDGAHDTEPVASCASRGARRVGAAARAHDGARATAHGDPRHPCPSPAQPPP